MTPVLFPGKQPPLTDRSREYEKDLKEEPERKVWRYRVDVVDFYHDRTKNPDNIVFPAPALIWQLVLSRRRVAGGLPKGTDSRGPRPVGRIGMKLSSGTGRKEG